MVSAIIALGCVTVFGVVGIISAFVRQLLLSREKRLNDLAQQRALQQELISLETIRQEMSLYKRYEVHYQVLGINKETIQYLDKRIDELLKKKSSLIDEYAAMVKHKSLAIIQAQETKPEDKEISDMSKRDLDEELHFLQAEIETLQKRRASLLDNHKDLLQRAVEQEKLRNEHLDAYYKQHIEILEKLYLRHNQNTQAIAEKSIDASTSTFKAVLLAPIYFLMSAFKISTEIDINKMEEEKSARDEVFKCQLSLNRAKNPSESGDGSTSLSHNKNGLFSNKTKDPVETDDTDFGFNLQSEFIF